MSPDPALTVRLAARAMARHNLVHAYGHVSMRLDAARFLVSSARPLGTIGAEDRGVIVRLDGDLPAGVLGEVRVHREIYRLRPDVGGICRIQPFSLMALSVLGETPRALHGLGTYFAPCPPLWDGVALLRDDTAARAVAERLGSANAIVMRGNGGVTVGSSLPEAACHAFFLEDAARLEVALLPSRDAGHPPREYSAGEARARAVPAGGLYDRMWQYLCFGDPEWPVILN